MLTCQEYQHLYQNTTISLGPLNINYEHGFYCTLVVYIPLSVPCLQINNFRFTQIIDLRMVQKEGYNRTIHRRYHRWIQTKVYNWVIPRKQIKNSILYLFIFPSYYTHRFFIVLRYSKKCIFIYINYMLIYISYSSGVMCGTFLSDGLGFESGVKGYRATPWTVPD